MKDKLIYIVAFALSFLLVTGGIIYLNTMYKNIFAFDFTSTASEEEAPAEEAGESEKQQVEQKKDEPIKEPEEPSEDVTELIINTDSIKAAMQKNALDSTELKKAGMDSAKVKKEKSVALEDSIKNLKQQLKDLASKKDIKKEAIADSIKQQYELAYTIGPKDSSYKAWIKKTVSLYEAMDSRKAAKIILTYSDNVAKDILYTMKKKKAAEILAQYSPEIVNRITRIK